MAGTIEGHMSPDTQLAAVADDDPAMSFSARSGHTWEELLGYERGG
jgi:hypothetical protein